MAYVYGWLAAFLCIPKDMQHAVLHASSLSASSMHAQVTRGLFMQLKQEPVDETISEAGSDEEEVWLRSYHRGF